jgi:HPt (histidine-containing phosphotransfer) domain-containing protein
LKAFFGEIPANTEMSFVVVTHLSPSRESLLHEVLRNFTKLPVEVIKDGDPVRPGVVHVMPEGNSLSIQGGRLALLKNDPALRDRKPIDDIIRRGGGPSARAMIVGLTAHQPPEIAVMLSNLAFDNCLRKPLDVHQLVALVQGAVPLATASTNAADFDIVKMAELRKIDGGAMLLRALNGFSAEIKSTRMELSILIEKCDTAEMGRLSHRLIGLCDLLGAQTLSAKLHEFQDEINTGGIEELKAAYERVCDAMIKTDEKVAQFIDSMS